MNTTSHRLLVVVWLAVVKPVFTIFLVSICKCHCSNVRLSIANNRVAFEEEEKCFISRCLEIEMSLRCERPFDTIQTKLTIALEITVCLNTKGTHATHLSMECIPRHTQKIKEHKAWGIENSWHNNGAAATPPIEIIDALTVRELITWFIHKHGSALAERLTMQPKLVCR